MTLLIISFVAGILTILAPCVLPLLPVIIGGSATDASNKAKPFIITASLSVSVIVFTLLLKASTLVIDIPPSFWTYFSGGILMVLGIFLLFPTLWERLPINAVISRKSNILLAEGSKKQSIWGDVIMGAALGPVFSTCSPTYFVILATVLPSSFALGIVYLLAYTAGLAIMLIAIALLGQRLVGKLSGTADPRGWVKRGMGLLILLVGIAIMTGVDKKIETAILDAGFFDVTSIEQRLLESVPDTETSPSESTAGSPQSSGAVAPELAGLAGYLNTDGKPITIEQFRGKGLVLIDFWTYSCINCRRTTPYLNAWHERYSDMGLTIIGVHTPEFAFEYKYDNVQKAMTELGIQYPVVLDNDYATWRAFKNKYWPRKYLIDENGVIVYDHIGEGGYEETERAIQKALAKLGRQTNDMPLAEVPNVTDVAFSKVESRETYFGSSRNEFLENGTQKKTGEQTFLLPTSYKNSKLYLEGTWNIQKEYAESVSDDARIVYKFEAKNVYLVMASQDGARVKVLVDGEPIHSNRAGVDVSDSSIQVNAERLYHIYTAPSYGVHTLELQVEEGAIQAFAFTFG